MDIRATVGSNIIFEREARQMPREELSRRTGLATSGLKHIEAGTRSAGIATLHMIAEVFGIPVSSLVIQHADREYPAEQSGQ